MVEVMKIMATSFKRSQAYTVTLSAPNHAAGHHQPTLLLETPGHSWASLGQSPMGSLLLSPGSWCAQGFVCALQESISPVLCKFWCLLGGVKTLQEGLCHPGSLHPEPLPLWQATADLYLHRSYSNTQRQVWLSLCGVSGVHNVSFEPSNQWRSNSRKSEETDQSKNNTQLWM